MRDIKALTDMVEDVLEQTTDQQRRAVQKLVCSRFANDTRDISEIIPEAVELMMMLGVHPSQKDALEAEYISIRRLRSGK